MELRDNKYWNRSDLQKHLKKFDDYQIILRILLREKIILEATTSYWGNEIDLICELYTMVNQIYDFVYKILKEDRNEQIILSQNENDVCSVYLNNIGICEKELKKNYQIDIGLKREYKN